MISEVMICNLALTALGQTTQITSLDEPTKAARLCRLWYAPTRDAVLEDHCWNFATRCSQLPLIEAPQTGEFSFAYRKPADCVRVRELERGTEFTMIGDEVHTDAAPASMIYTARVEDPNSFSAKFVRALAYNLAAALAVPLMQSNRLEQSMMSKYREFLAGAEEVDSSEGQIRPVEENAWIEARE